MTMSIPRLRIRRALLGASLALGLSLSLTLGAPRVYAETPKDTLVLAWAFDDIITMDPGESFEISTAEILGNVYSTLVRLNIDDTSEVLPSIAESWTVSDDALTYTFTLKPGITFASGNPITAEDVAFSFERAIKMDKGPAFILAQFGLTGENITEKAKALDAGTFQFTVDKPYAPSFVLNCLTATVAMVVDKKLVTEHAEAVTPSAESPYDTDFGNGWLKTHYAGSGPFILRDWRANEVLVLERNDTYFGEKAKLARVLYRHLKESAGQRLALEAGDIDVARNLEPGDLVALEANKDIAIESQSKGTVYYFSLNQKNPILAKPKVREAIKYLVDDKAIGATLIKGIGTLHQTYIPAGMLGAIDDRPYHLDVDKAKTLLAEAGLPDGFTVTMDVRTIQPVTGIAESIQQTFAQAGITLEIIPGDGKQVLTKYRARNHDIYIGQWGTDYWDPNSNAETFSSNPDNADDASSKTLAWRNAWDIPALTEETASALLERDTAKRAATYADLQRKVLADGPFVLLYQQTEVGAYRINVKDYRLGPSFDTNYVDKTFKE
ncbi:MAG: ABC transporter substrate-binding protein [Rhodospirillum sp.]|nr:ABC transporter substrate-binding protein [Rhodospirillum sp.]MCF8490739.1 ABC transporter substrate-binding protein [Rhodospirillum sp.]MCF8503199.1 ABC transporter substrate-binding protein [Rhodospirillum sp.]